MTQPTTGKTLAFDDRFNRPKPAWSTRGVDFTDTSTRARADDSCARVVDGEMVLSVQTDPATPGAYLTGHVGTEHAREFTYGYFETKAKFPPLRGAHAAFWLQTTEDYIPGQAEIDVAECFGRPAVWHNVFWREPGQNAGEFNSHKQVTDLGRDGAQSSWHVYGLDWQPDRYAFYVDGALVATTTVGLSDRPKFLVLSLLVKDFEVDLLDPARLRDYRARFKYVRVWQ